MPKGNYITPEILHDAPLATIDDEFDFNFNDFAATISRLIASKKTKTPLAICISGAWGSGKTTLLHRIEMMLDKTFSLKKDTEPEVLEFANNNESPQAIFRHCQTVWFNAWKYSDEEELLVALIRVIIQKMADDTLVNKAMGKLLDPTYPRRDVINTVLSWFKVAVAGVEVQLNSGQEIPTRLSEKTAILDLFDDAFDKLMAVWVHRRINAKEINQLTGVLVVFIDDLDRCLPKKMIQVLEAVKLFLDKRGCIFVLGADTSILQQAILKNYQDAGVTGETAKDYLDKVVQLRFELPPIIEKSMENYLKKEKVIGTDWEDSWKLLITSANANPRSVKAFVNDVNLQWSMLVNLERAKNINRADFNGWQVLMRTAPLNFVRHIRVRLHTSEQRHKYILDAIKWAKGEFTIGEAEKTGDAISLNDKFSDYSGDYRFRRVLEEITFGDDFTPDVLDIFLHLTARSQVVNVKGNIEFGISMKATGVENKTNVTNIATDVIDKIIGSDKTKISGKRKLNIFMIYEKSDKIIVTGLIRKLGSEGFDVWDDEKILPGQDWSLEISKFIHSSDVMIVCLSEASAAPKGYIERETKLALDVSLELPEGDIFIIPVRLEDCVIPKRLSNYQWVDLYGDNEQQGYVRLLRALRTRADSLGIELKRSVK